MSLNKNILLRKISGRSLQSINKETVKTKQAKSRPRTSVANSRSLIINCNYPGSGDFELFGCWGDGDLFEKYVKSIDPSGNIVRMKDVDKDDDFWNDASGIRYTTHFPSRSNILKRLDEFSKGKEKVLYLYFSGHGNLQDNISKSERNVVDCNSNYIPLNPRKDTVLKLENPEFKNGFYNTNGYGVYDYANNEFLLDNEIYNFINKLKKDQTCYIFTDICHSGTTIDLPYINVGDYSNGLTDDEGNPILDSNENPKYWPGNPNAILTATDISNILTTYATDASFNIKFEVDTGKTRKPPAAKIIHFAGTRTETLSYEGYVIDLSDNEVSHGFGTWAHDRLLRYGADKLTLRQYYTCLVGLVNDTIQIPMCSTSAPNVLDISGYLVTLNDPSKATSRTRTIPSVQEKIAYQKSITSIKLNKNKKLR